MPPDSRKEQGKHPARRRLNNCENCALKCAQPCYQLLWLSDCAKRNPKSAQSEV